MGLLRGRKQYFQSPFRGWIERLDDAIFLDRDDAFDVVQDGMQWALPKRSAYPCILCSITSM
jgi:1-acyl-sn-glycerol-3-phosphate acyltransferase